MTTLAEPCPAPYYQDESVTLYRNDCREVLASMDDRSVDCVITDPPYSGNTHKNARSNVGPRGARTDTGTGTRALAGAFDSITLPDLTDVLAECGRVSRGWVIATLDYRHAFRLEESPPPGLRVLRIGVWVKTNPMPQISGDRPAQGWEAIVYMHRTDIRPHWNGGGKHGNYVHATAGTKGGHPTPKPLPIVSEWVRLFTNPGDLILDPYAGGGTTLRAAADEGRRAIGVEIDEGYCEMITRRLAQCAMVFGD